MEKIMDIKLNNVLILINKYNMKIFFVIVKLYKYISI